MNVVAIVSVWASRRFQLGMGNIPVGVSLWVCAMSLTWGEATTPAVDLVTVCLFGSGYALMLYGLLDWSNMRGFSTQTLVVGTLAVVLAVIFSAFLSEDVLEMLSGLIVPCMIILVLFRKRDGTRGRMHAIYISVLAVTGIVVHVWKDMQDGMMARVISIFMLQFIVLLSLEVVFSGLFSSNQVVNGVRRPASRI